MQRMMQRLRRGRANPDDPDRLVTRRAARRVGIQVAALSAFMVLAGVFMLMAFLWLDSEHHDRYSRRGSGHDDTVWLAIDPEDVMEVGILVTIGVLVFAGVGAMLFASQAVRPLAESMRRQRNFIGDASHELRTPLAVLDARVQQAQILAASNPEMERVLSDLREDSQVMIDIVNDLLASVSEHEAEFEPADLRAVLSQVQQEALVVAETAEVRLMVNTSALPKGSVLVDVPAIPLRRSLLALVENGIGHTGPGCEVVVEANPEGRWYVIRVTDQGHGITGIDPDRVFERFARGTPSSSEKTSPRPSHGIGLSLVHDVVSRYGGSVEVERTGGEGTVFRLLLPSLRGR